VLQVLTDPQPQKLSHEECYRLIYKVCQAHQKELWINLENTVTSVLDSFRDSLTQLTDAHCPPVDWFVAFSRGFLAYQEAMRILPLIFQYLERVYLTERLGTKLHNELKTKMRRCLNTPAVLSALRVVLPHCTPRTLDPSSMHRLIVDLTDYNRSLAQDNLALFSVHVPGLTPSQGLEADVAETRALWSLTAQQCADMCDMDTSRSSSLLGKRKFAAM
jgi:hypothetical protein